MLNQSLSQNVEEETRGRQSRSKLSLVNQIEQKPSSQLATRKPTPRRSTRGEPADEPKATKKETKASLRNSRKQSQEDKAVVPAERKPK